MKNVIRFCLLFFAVIFIAACSETENRLQPSPLVQFKSTISIRQLWSVNIGSGVNKYYLRLTPMISGGKIFVPSSDGNVTAVDVKTGKIVWQNSVSESITSGISANRGHLYVADGKGNLLALSQADGKVIWKTPVASEILTTPTSWHGVVIVKSLDGSLTALSESDGRQLWRFQQEVPSLTLHASSQPEIAGKYVVAGFANGKLAAINYRTGKVAWIVPIAMPKGTTAIEQMVDIDVNPVVVNGIVYVATYQGNIAAIDLNSGRLLWSHRISSYGGIAADFSRIYVSDAKSYLWAFDNNSGAVFWRQAKLSGRQITGPTIFGRYVVVGDFEGYLHFVGQHTGQFVARVQTDDSGLIAAPVVSDHVLYAYTAGGDLYAYRIAK